MKILNLYAGIGGNRKLWGEEHEITAVELNPSIAAIYQDFFPGDKVIVGDAHQYLLDHYKEFDFIWSSPPCPTHSRMNRLREVKGWKDIKYPDMTLYQEIIHLDYWFKGQYCVENVISYYNPLIPPIESGSHYYWTNFYFRPIKNETRNTRRQHNEKREAALSLNLDRFNLNKHFRQQVVNNCVEPKHGLHILNTAIGAIPPIQEGLFKDVKSK